MFVVDIELLIKVTLLYMFRGEFIMITLVRWYIMKTKEIKYRLALWQFIDQQAKELLKNPEEIEKKFVSALAEIIHNESPKKDS